MLVMNSPFGFHPNMTHEYVHYIFISNIALHILAQLKVQVQVISSNCIPQYQLKIKLTSKKKLAFLFIYTFVGISNLFLEQTEFLSILKIFQSTLCFDSHSAIHKVTVLFALFWETASYQTVSGSQKIRFSIFSVRRAFLSHATQLTQAAFTPDLAHSSHWQK